MSLYYKHNREDLNEMIGESQGAYFSLEMMRRVQTLKQAFHPPTPEQFNAEIDMGNRKKKSNEYRLISVDLAFTADAEGKAEESDNTVLKCLSFIYDTKTGRTTRAVEYIETHAGGDDKHTVRRIKELFQDYQADYIVLDERNGGTLIFNALTTPYENPYRDPARWDSRGLILCRDDLLHVINQGKRNELLAREVDKNGIPCIIPVAATSELNSNMWQSLFKAINNQSLKLLIDDLEVEQEFEDKKFALMTSEEKRDFKLPYVQTTLLINEMINLSQSWNNGLLKLTQPRSGHKDRATALQYANYICDKLENKISKELQVDEYDMDDWAKALLG